MVTSSLQSDERRRNLLSSVVFNRGLLSFFYAFSYNHATPCKDGNGNIILLLDSSRGAGFSNNLTKVGLKH